MRPDGDWSKRREASWITNTGDVMSYLTETQIEAMADAALTSYEFACDWDEALHAAVEYSIDEYGIKPRRSAALLALKQAKLRWHGASLAAPTINWG